MQTKHFPQPVELPGMRARWRMSDIELFEYGETKRTPETERYLSANQLGARYGITRVAVWKQARLAREAAA